MTTTNSVTERPTMLATATKRPYALLLAAAATLTTAGGLLVPAAASNAIQPTCTTLVSRTGDIVMTKVDCPDKETWTRYDGGKFICHKENPKPISPSQPPEDRCGLIA